MIKKINIMEVPEFGASVMSIKNSDIRNFTIAALEAAPLQFWIMPASTRSNIHHVSEHEEGSVMQDGNLAKVQKIGGKAFHTLRVLKFAECQIETDRVAVVNQWTNVLKKNVPGNEYSDREEDIIRAACLLHDIYSGGTGDEYNAKARGMDKYHPHYHRTELDEILLLLPEKDRETLLQAIENHMWKYDEFKTPISFHHMKHMPTVEDAFAFASRYRIIKVVEISDYLAAQNI